MGVVSKGEHFNHRVQDNHNPDEKQPHDPKWINQHSRLLSKTSPHLMIKQNTDITFSLCYLVNFSCTNEAGTFVLHRNTWQHWICSKLRKTERQCTSVFSVAVRRVYLSRRSFTALTSVENSISMTVFFFKSSQIITRVAHQLKLFKQWATSDTLKNRLSRIHVNPDSTKWIHKK